MFKSFIAYHNPNTKPSNFISITDDDFFEYVNPISSNNNGSFSHTDIAITVAGFYFIKNLNVAANLVLFFKYKKQKGLLLTINEMVIDFLNNQPFELCSREELEKYLTII